MKTDDKLDQAKQAATHAGEAARHLGQRVKRPMHRISDRALHKLSGLHERLHEVAAEERRGEDDDSGRGDSQQLS